MGRRTDPMEAFLRLLAEIGVVASELIVVPIFPQPVARDRRRLAASPFAPFPAARKRLGAPSGYRQEAATDARADPANERIQERANMNSQEFANRFFNDAAPPNGPEGWWSERCPTGKHENPTRGEFGWKDGDVSIVMKCQKGCSRDAILTALGLTKLDLRLDALTVADLARLTGFTVDYLTGLGVENAN